VRAPTLRHARPWLAAAVLAAGALVSFGGQASAAVTYDGGTQATAAASCWEIKQVKPDATDGLYWLETPQLNAPTQFYCDMTTDGGGWVLVGRGRENWVYDYNGKGTPAQVAGTVTGTGAFSPRQLDGHVINALLGGRRFDSFSDGVRLRRATNEAGTKWQESRFTFKSRDRWTWAFGAGHPVSSVTIGGSSASTGTTREVGFDQEYKRFWTYEDTKNGYVRGFNYGKDGTGSTSASSYIYSKASGGQYGTPFTQMFIRPKLRTSDVDYGTVGDSGTSAITGLSVARSGALPTSWGVTGTGSGGTGELATETQAFAQIGNRMFVGGNFTTVQKGASATGADKVAQPYVAAFDATSGDWISSFRPTVDGQVKSLSALPDGTLAIGGEFAKVNGAARAGIAVLDPSTGATVPTAWPAIENRTKGGKVSVRALDQDGTYLYVGGAFTHFVKGTSATYARNLGRIKLSTAAADGAWNPDLNGTVDAVDVSDDKSAVYASGYFTTSKGTAADRAVALKTATGADKVAAWQPTFSTSGSARYQQAVKQVGSKVWLGGSQHSMFSYDPQTFALEEVHITKAGGDIQAIDGGNGYAYGGCHCGDWNYDTSNYDGTTPGQTNVSWTQGDDINYVGAWDAKTGAYAPDFTPRATARNGYGAWSLKVAADGTLWTGGSFTSVVRENGASQWVGGFMRFAVRDTTPPAKPSGLAVQVSGGTADVSWTASPGGADSYEVIQGNRVVGTTTSTSLKVDGATSGDRYFVRAADSAGNRSASTSVVTAAAAPVQDALVPAASTWSYWVNSAQPVAAGWQDSGYDASGWASGAAPLGWGSGVTTNVDVAAGQTRPVTQYYRRTFTVADPGSYATVTLTTRADDGIVIRVNGTEVGRKNLPAGTPAAGTYATAAPSTAAAAADPLVVQVPTSLLVAGTNVITAEVHSNYKGTPSSSFEATVVGRR
jgi:hypothetical protein